MRDRGGEILEGKYRLIRQIGKGGMGSVYVAEHVGIGKRVAVKLLHRELAANEEAVRRFHQEARAAAAAGHPGIVDIHDIGVTADGEPYLVMELLDGESLGTLLERDGPLPVRRAVDISLAALSALAAAHRRGVVHRDVKPDNVFLERTMSEFPSVKILDFGVSKMTAVGPGTTMGGVALGTPHYMAPEQARGDVDLDARVDLYAVGVILYQALTGVVPFDGPFANAVMVRAMTVPPRPPRELRPDLPEALEAVILRALEKEPASRFRRAEEMIEALLELGGVEPTARAALLESRGDGAAEGYASATPQSWSTDVPVPGRRRVWLPVALVLAVLLIAGAGVLVLGRSADQPDVIEAKWTAPVHRGDPSASSGPASPSAHPVTITLEGLPPAARVTLDGAVVDEMPMKLVARPVMLALRVEADGYAPFARMVVPDRDQTITLGMTPLGEAPIAPAEPATASASRRRRTGTDRARSASSPPGSPGASGSLPPIIDPGPLPPIVDPGPGLPPIVSPGPGRAPAAAPRR